MRPRISIRGSVCLSVWSVRWAFYRTAEDVETAQNNRKSQDMDPWLQINCRLPVNNLQYTCKKSAAIISLSLPSDASLFERTCCSRPRDSSSYQVNLRCCQMSNWRKWLRHFFYNVFGVPSRKTKKKKHITFGLQTGSICGWCGATNNNRYSIFASMAQRVYD